MLFNCYTYVKSLGQFHWGSLPVGPMSVSYYEPMLVGSVSSFVMTLTPLGLDYLLRQFLRFLQLVFL